ncbi:stage II sporulation protein M [Staphylococcus argenteus]|nr:stage II sporulation protein M [Staphylococcus argenteus]
MHDLSLSSFLKRSNKFMQFNCFICLILIIVFYIIGMNIHDFSDFPSKDLNHKVLYNFNGFLKIFVNNAFIVPLVSLILSIIPIPYLYFIPTISTIYSLSAIIGVTFSYKLNEGIAIFIGILPHGILEIYLTSIELSMLFLLNAYIRKKSLNLLKKKKRDIAKFFLFY